MREPGRIEERHGVCNMKLMKVILIGPRVSKYIGPLIPNAQTFEMPQPGLDYIAGTLSGGETILFKGARFLEGIVEKLLLNRNDVQKLVRREKAWQNRRKAWGL